jgi:hypothetical protein
MRRMIEGGLPLRPLAGLFSRSVALVLAVSSWVHAGPLGDGDGPELSPPADMPATARPLAPARARPVTPSSVGSRAVLAIPGFTTPPARSPGIITSSPSTSIVPGSSPSLDDLPLDGPIEMRGVPPVAGARPGSTTGRAPLPMTLETLPMDPSPLPGDPEARINPSAGRSSPAPALPGSTPGPARRGRFFGRTPGQAVVPPLSRSASPGRSVAEDALVEPSAETGLKRRIEKQAREAVGDRARWIEVRITGKSVAVQAHGVRFYQKRAVRKSLESLPALAGLRSSIEVAD